MIACFWHKKLPLVAPGWWVNGGDGVHVIILYFCVCLKMSMMKVWVFYLFIYLAVLGLSCGTQDL